MTNKDKDLIKLLVRLESATELLSVALLETEPKTVESIMYANDKKLGNEAYTKSHVSLMINQNQELIKLVKEKYIKKS